MQNQYKPVLNCKGASLATHDRNMTTDMVSEVLHRPPLLVTECGGDPCGICVSLKHGLVIVFEHRTTQLHVYSLVDGSRVRSIGFEVRDNNRAIFSIDCGLCTSPDGDSVLVPAYFANWVQQIGITGKTCIRRFFGQGVLTLPKCADCNNKVVAVSEGVNRISVFSFQTGDVVSQFGREILPGQLDCPLGLRLLSHNRLVVVNYRHRWLSVFGLKGEFIQPVGCRPDRLVVDPVDVLECRSGFLIASHTPNLVVMSSDGKIKRVRCRDSVGALAPLPDGGLVTLERSRFRVFVGLHLRVAWAQLCCVVACSIE